MKKNIWIWGMAAIVCLGIIIGGYSVYVNKGDKVNEHKQSGHGEHSGHSTSATSEVTPKVSYANGEITIELKDKNGNIPSLEVSHEKLMHLIVVGADLKQYYHLHPEEVGKEGVYLQKFDLTGDSYKVFVDIKPKDLSYSVEPIELHIEEAHHGHGENKLVVDTEFTKIINNQAVELTISSFEVNKEVTLAFDVKDAKPEPYLGALGHVVILDENGEDFIHVHPASNDETIFNTQFTKPGVYKIWAEFKFGEQVNVYPFVVEIK